MAGKGRLTVTSVTANGDIQSTHQYNVSVKFEIGFDYGGYNSAKRPYSITCDGQTKSGSNSFNVSSGNGTFKYATMGTLTFPVTMPTSGAAKTISISATCSTGVTPATITASTSYTLPAVTWAYTVSYDANGGENAPESQTKSHGTALTLSSDVPTRASAIVNGVTFDYVFKGWATSADGSATYQAGGSFTTDATTTLYAVWEAVPRVAIGKPAAVVKSVMQNGINIALIHPEYEDGVSFGSWEVTTTSGKYNVSGDTLTVKWDKDETILAYIRVVDSNGSKSETVKVVCNIRKRGFCVYDKGRWKKVSPYVYRDGEYKRLNGAVYDENSAEWFKYINRGTEVTYLTDASGDFLTDESGNVLKL